ncbi:MAG: bifunctional UDP-N-acetylglucosamine diphosphorylase/glucosamine-1-phosphate N-acetyltransferase GlmU [Hyphomicrobiaceae bacterium]|nr:bifunctional UDP-N-acetylglucosamine diphosphorylase/glucosamine-1-phosphate N-acetyltransferase GlmU [Hyphomicrobiaceae bacterium]
MKTAHRQPLLTIVLAAGKGTRMKSEMPKVLHQVGGLPMVGHVLKTATASGSTNTAIVVGPGMTNVSDAATKLNPSAGVYVQTQQLGTGDAVLAARDAIASHEGDVLVMFGDTPLIRPETVARLVGALDGGAEVAVLGFHAKDPTGYGRLITDGLVSDGVANLLSIREQKDATTAERQIDFCNSGVIAFRTKDLLGCLNRIGANNASGEYYLTDVISIMRADGRRAVAVAGLEVEMLGVNSRAHLAEAEGVFQRRARDAAMAGGATLIDPATVWFSHDTVIGRDVLIEPNVFFGPGVSIGNDVTIHANSHLTGAIVEDSAELGPFARLRPGARIGKNAKIGNFVEVKNATFEPGAKANHLAYIGDARVGSKANIGAGTIFCNYDGYFKHKTDIGAGAFIGSNSSLVAPVKIGDGAMIGSGSVITKDVAADSLALARPVQESREGWAGKFRAMMTKKKASAAK